MFLFLLKDEKEENGVKRRGVGSSKKYKKWCAFFPFLYVIFSASRPLFIFRNLYSPYFLFLTPPSTFFISFFFCLYFISFFSFCLFFVALSPFCLSCCTVYHFLCTNGENDKAKARLPIFFISQVNSKKG